MDLFAFMDKVLEYGLRGVHIDSAHLPQGDQDYLDVLREEAEERALFLEYGIPGVEPSIVHAGIRICRSLGSRTVRASLGFSRYAPGINVNMALSTAEDQLRSCVRSLEDADVRLALHTEGALRSQELVTLVETIGSTHVGICLDVGSSLCVLEDPIDAAERMVPFALTAQIRDYRITPSRCGCTICGVPLGQGVLPLQELYRILEEEGTVEHVILEVPLEAARGDKHAAEREEAAIRTSVEYCRSVLGVGASETGL